MLLRAWHTISRRRPRSSNVEVTATSRSISPTTFTFAPFALPFRTRLAIVGTTLSILLTFYELKKFEAESAAILAEMGDGLDGVLNTDDADVDTATTHDDTTLRSTRLEHNGRIIYIAMAGDFERSTVAVISAGSIAAARPLMSELAAQGIPSLSYTHGGLGPAVVSGIEKEPTRSEKNGASVFHVIQRLFQRTIVNTKRIGDSNPMLSASLLPARTGGQLVPTSNVLADELGAVLRAAQVSRAVLVGVHFDWLAVTKTALKNSSRIGGLVLLDPWLPSSSIALRSISDTHWLKQGDVPQNSVLAGPVNDDTFQSHIVDAVNSVLLKSPFPSTKIPEAVLLPPLRGALFPILSLPPFHLFPPAAFSQLLANTTPYDQFFSKHFGTELSFYQTALWFSKTAPPSSIYGGDLLFSIANRQFFRGAVLGPTGTLRIPRTGSSITLLAAPLASCHEDITRAFIRCHALRNSSLEDTFVRRALHYALPSIAEFTAFVATGASNIKGQLAVDQFAEWRATTEVARTTYQSANMKSSFTSGSNDHNIFSSSVVDALIAEDHTYSLVVEAHTNLEDEIERLNKSRRRNSWFSSSPLPITPIQNEDVILATNSLIQRWEKSNIETNELTSLRNVALTLVGALPYHTIPPPLLSASSSNATTNVTSSKILPNGPPPFNQELLELLELRSSVLSHAGFALINQIHPLSYQPSNLNANLNGTLQRYVQGSAVASRAAVRDSVSAAVWRIPLNLLDKWGNALSRGAPSSAAIVPLTEVPFDMNRRVTLALTDYSLNAFGARPWSISAFFKAATRHDNERVLKGDLVRVAAEVGFLSRSPTKKGSSSHATARPGGGWRIRSPQSNGLMAWVSANLGSAQNSLSLTTTSKSSSSSSSAIPFPVSILLTQQSEAQVLEDAVLPPQLIFPSWPSLSHENAKRISKLLPWNWLENNKSEEEVGTLALSQTIPAPPLLRHARGLLKEEQRNCALAWAAALQNSSCIINLPAETSKDVSSTVLATANRAMKRDGITWTGRGQYTINSSSSLSHSREGDLGDADAITSVSDAIAYGPPQPYRPSLARVAAQVALHVRNDNSRRVAAVVDAA